MLVRLTRAMRLRSAGVMAVLYLLCILAPAAAFAFGDPSRTAHCLTDSSLSGHVHGKNGSTAAHSRSAATPADHSHPTDHSHDMADGTAAVDSQCCGLFCLSSLPAGLLEIAPPYLPTSPAISTITEGLAGNGPDRLYRPPICSLSI
jgi:hypothetical protein